MKGQLQRIRTKMGNLAMVSRLRKQLGEPDLVIFYGAGLGDDLMSTAILREMAKRGSKRLWMMSNNRVLFQGNSDVAAIIPEDRWLFGRMPKIGYRTLDPHWAHYDAQQDRDILTTDRHAITEMCRMAGVTGTIEQRPYLHLTPEEMASGKLVERQIVIHSTGMGARFAIPTKEWYPERFQQVVDALKDKYNFVQLGLPTDPLLEGALDMRGKSPLRQTAAIVANSLVSVVQVGFLMHLARAVDCRTVVVYGGREHPRQSGYGCFDNLYSPVECSPCWLGVHCPNNKVCMDMISAAQVVTAIERQVALAGTPLSEDKDVI